MNSGAAGLVAQAAWLLVFVALFLGAGYALRRRRREPPAPVADGPPDEPYRIHTRAYDLELEAAEVPAKLPTASPDAANGWYQRDHALWSACIPRVRTLLAEQDDEAWNATLERVKAAAEALPPGALVVSLLIDQSGSMNGARIAWAAVLATRITGLLAMIGARSEVLGFSTAGWHGGYAYANWRDVGRPPRSGRLCALMHVVYKSGEEDALSEAARDLMLDPALLRENVDGEAILWARSRLAARPETYKLLIVVSDGAPVDDATLMHNGPSYLYRHLIAVLGELAQDRSLTLGGVGLDHRVDTFYPISEVVHGPDDLPKATARLLEAMIGAAAAKAGGRSRA